MVQYETSLNTFRFIIFINSIRRLQNQNSKIGPKINNSILPCFLSIFWKQINSKKWLIQSTSQLGSVFSQVFSTFAAHIRNCRVTSYLWRKVIKLSQKEPKSANFLSEELSNQNKFFQNLIFLKYLILRRSDGGHKNHKIRKGLYKCYLVPANQTSPKDKIYDIRHDLLGSNRARFWIVFFS